MQSMLRGHLNTPTRMNVKFANWMHCTRAVVDVQTPGRFLKHHMKVCRLSTRAAAADEQTIPLSVYVAEQNKAAERLSRELDKAAQHLARELRGQRIEAA